MRDIYIMLACSIGNIGGGQMYCRNKCVFLKEKGVEVCVFYSRPNDSILINELKQFSNNLIEELTFPPYYFTTKKQRSIINNIINRSNLTQSLLNDGQNVIIESNTINGSLWGEKIASELKCKNFIFLLQEEFGHLPLGTLSYFDYKHKRRELAGIGSNSLALLFNGYKEIKENEKYSLIAMCTNVVEDVENDLIDRIEKKDINIGCITRLEKNYVPGLIEEVINFADKYREKRIQLVLFGGADNIELEEKIKNRFKGIENLNLEITGYLFPIPRKIFQLIDVFVSVSGSAIISVEEGVPTIALDVIDGNPIGILGYNTNNSLYRDSEDQTSIVYLLEKCLFDNKIDWKKVNLGDLQFIDFREEFINHMKFIAESTNAKDYYNFKKYRLEFRERIKKIIFLTLGNNGYNKIQHVMSILGFLES